MILEDIKLKLLTNKVLDTTKQNGRLFLII